MNQRIWVVVTMVLCLCSSGAFAQNNAKKTAKSPAKKTAVLGSTGIQAKLDSLDREIKQRERKIAAEQKKCAEAYQRKDSLGVKMAELKRDDSRSGKDSWRERSKLQDDSISARTEMRDACFEIRELKKEIKDLLHQKEKLEVLPFEEYSFNKRCTPYPSSLSWKFKEPYNIFDESIKRFEMFHAPVTLKNGAKGHIYLIPPEYIVLPGSLSRDTGAKIFVLEKDGVVLALKPNVTLKNRTYHVVYSSVGFAPRDLVEGDLGTSDKIMLFICELRGWCYFKPHVPIFTK